MDAIKKLLFLTITLLSLHCTKESDKRSDWQLYDETGQMLGRAIAKTEAEVKAEYPNFCYQKIGAPTYCYERKKEGEPTYTGNYCGYTDASAKCILGRGGYQVRRK